MDIAAAKLLTAEIDRVPGLRACVHEGWICFEGGRYGPQYLDVSASTEERVRAHWAGYVTNQRPAEIRKSESPPWRLW